MKEKIERYWNQIKDLFSFVFQISLFVIYKVLSTFSQKFLKKEIKKDSFISRLYLKINSQLEAKRIGSISRLNLIEISFDNMSSKKTRTWITVGGIAMGISLIVFLVSIGYGLERLVIQRVSRLEELKQTDVLPGISNDLSLTDSTINTFKQIPNVVEVIPVISAVAKVNYQNSSTDMAVYGVTTKYLKESAVKPIAGIIFDNNDTQTAFSELLQNTSLDNSSDSPEPEKLLDISSDGSLPVVEIATLSAQQQQANTNTVVLGGDKKREIVINKAALNVLGLKETEAVGKKIKASFVALSNNGDRSETRIQSLDTEYKIIGVIPDISTPVFYVPFVDLRSMGINNYSQIKVVVNNPASLAKVRQNIESGGYGTISVVDTISQIDNLFSSIRTFLGVLGVVALSVAAMGMFNTLTVSLLERTREVGLMKAIGMKSSEVKELFLTESMIMGFFGGVIGLILGILSGSVLSIFMSLISVLKGTGLVSVTHVPFFFSLVIITISLLVGIGTGYVPARRATKISALDALRYE